MKETKNVFMSELTEVFSKRQQQFVQFAYSYVRNREEAEDIVMGAFTNVWEHRNELQEDTNISALLLTAIKNRSLNHLQHLEVRMRAEQHIGDMRQKELALRISTLEACDPDKLFCDEIQAQHRRAASLLQLQAGHTPPDDRNGRRAVGRGHRLRSQALRARRTGFHGEGQLRTETLPAADDEHVGRRVHRIAQHAHGIGPCGA